MQDLTTEVDSHIAAYRQGTIYEGVRKSDIKVFILASRQPRSMSAMARDLSVSRQAVHDSVKRLIALDVVELIDIPNNGRDKQVAVTERGTQGRLFALAQVEKLEVKCAEILGKEEFELFRKMLLTLLTGLKQNASQPDQATGV